MQKAIEAALPQAQVASSKQVADKISGSLVDASNLSHNLGVVLSIVAAAAAFLLAALLALSSVGKRVRELGTLKALGWTQRMVVRQIAGESLAQGVLGGVFGIVLGVLVVARDRRVRADALGAARPPEAATCLGLGAAAARTATSSVSLSAPVGVTVLAIGFGLALLGGPDRGDGRRAPRRAPPPRRRAEAGGLMALYRARGVAKFFQRGPDDRARARRRRPRDRGRASSSRSRGRAAPARRRCCSCSARSTGRARGTIVFEGRDLAALPDRELAALRLRSFGFVFQQFNLIPTLTAVENVEVKLAPTGGGARAGARAARRGRARRARRPPAGPLSGGEQQRVAIARALSVEPRVVLADEPTGNLDSTTGGEIIELLAGLAAEHGSTVIVATHDAASQPARRGGCRCATARLPVGSPLPPCTDHSPLVSAATGGARFETTVAKPVEQLDSVVIRFAG